MYMLFTGNHYYPRGGWEDYEDSFTSETDAIVHFESMNYAPDWGQVVCGGRIVKNLDRRLI